MDALPGTDATGNACVVRAVLHRQPEPVRDAVVLNATAVLVTLNKDDQDPIVGRIHSAMERVVESIDLGRWADVLDR